MDSSSPKHAAIGSQVGPYRIEAVLGRGGMGTVYLAVDSRLQRQVAIKIPHEPFDERFAREGRSIAALNHPNICTVYDVGPNYLVMELVEGETLAERMGAGAIPLAETLAIARQVAEALEAAHERGIVHRDLKPANIKIKLDGSVKVLDFGLARAASSLELPGPNDSTVTRTITETGVVVGTPSYMAPEQLLGQAVDKRADIWALGVVLWEMLNGRRLFGGGTTALTLEVLREPIDFGTLTKPATIENLLRRCLERDVKMRLRDVGEARIAIQQYWANPQSADESSKQAERRPSSGKFAWAAATVLGITALTLGLMHFRESPTEQPLARLNVDLGGDVSLSPLTGPSTVVISPDGTRLVYMAGHPSALFVRKLDQPDAIELPGTRGARMPFFSPDGRWLGFFAANKINKVSVDGGAVLPLYTSTVPVGASWGEDGNIVMSLGAGKGLGEISSEGQPVTLTETARGELVHAFPEVLPGGKAVLFVSFSTPMDVDRDTIDVVTLADHRRKTLIRGGVTPHYLPSGYLTYTKRSTLFAIPFDLKKLETRGTAVPILDDVAFHAPTAGAQYDVSRNGTLVYRKHGGGGATSDMMTVQWVSPEGKREPLFDRPAVCMNPRLSPNGKQLALTIAEGSRRDIWIYDLARDSMTRLTSSGTNDYPLWSPDGKYVVFFSGGTGIFWTRSDGATQPQLLVRSKDGNVPWSFAPDGTRLAYFPTGSLPQIWTIPLLVEGGQLKAGKPEQFLKSQFVDKEASFSPDGHWLAYDSNESGVYQIYVRAFPPPASGEGGKWQISNSGGDFPIWAPGGGRLLYRADDQLMAVNYQVRGEAFEADEPRVWISKLSGTWASLAPDGRRVAVLSPADIRATDAREHELVFVMNFFDELRRRVPLNSK